jgi:hypothetical protein
MMQKTLTILLLVSVALWGLTTCTGAYTDPGAMGMGKGGLGGLADLFGGFGEEDDDDDGSYNPYNPYNPGGTGGGNNPTSLVGTWKSSTQTYVFTSTTVTWGSNSMSYIYNSATGQGRIPATGTWTYDIMPASPPAVNKIRLEPSGSAITLTKQ